MPPAVVRTRDYLKVIEKCLAFCNNMGIDTLRVDTVSAPAALEDEIYKTRFDRL